MSKQRILEIHQALSTYSAKKEVDDPEDLSGMSPEDRHARAMLEVTSFIAEMSGAEVLRLLDAAAALRARAIELELRPGEAQEWEESRRRARGMAEDPPLSMLRVSIEAARAAGAPG